MAKHYGGVQTKMFSEYLKDVANSSNFRGDAAAAADHAIDYFRMNTISVLVGMNPGTVIKHGTTAFVNSIFEGNPLKFFDALTSLIGKSDYAAESNHRFAMNNSNELPQRFSRWMRIEVRWVMILQHGVS
jgi:hypothetical protein